MTQSYTDVSPLTVHNNSDKEICIAGFVFPPKSTNNKVPQALLPAIRARPELTIVGAVITNDKLVGAHFKRQETIATKLFIGPQPEIGISVVIPVKDRGDMLRRACRSVMASSYSNYELIVVQDGSEPNVLKAIEPIAVECRDLGINFVHVYCSLNQGVGAARNIGAALAQHELILMLDSDDEITPDALSIAAEAFTTTRADIIYGCLRIHNDQTGQDIVVEQPEWRKGQFKKHGCYIQGARFISKRAWRAISGCDPSYRYAEDLDLLIRLEERGAVFCKVENVLGIVHDHEGRLTKIQSKDVNLAAGMARQRSTQ